MAYHALAHPQPTTRHTKIHIYEYTRIIYTLLFVHHRFTSPRCCELTKFSILIREYYMDTISITFCTWMYMMKTDETRRRRRRRCEQISFCVPEMLFNYICLLEQNCVYTKHQSHSRLRCFMICSYIGSLLMCMLQHSSPNGGLVREARSSAFAVALRQPWFWRRSVCWPSSSFTTLFADSC